MLGAVECERTDGRPSAGRDSHDLAAVPSEMMIPLLLAWVEESHRDAGRGIARGLPRSFTQRTMHAREREIGERGGAAGRDGNDMIHMKRGCLPKT